MFTRTRRSRRPVSNLQSSLCLLGFSTHEIHPTQEHQGGPRNWRQQGMKVSPYIFSCVLALSGTA